MQENFVDYVKIYCKAGKGGAGSAHLRRDRLTSKGGPDGGDGGQGGEGGALHGAGSLGLLRAPGVRG